MPGKNKGLVVILDLHKDLVQPGSKSTDENFFSAMINPTGIFPTANYKSVRVIPGHINTITISASLQTADQDISLIDPKDRNCFFPEENQSLKLHQNYSQYSCFLECSLQFAQEVVQVSCFYYNPQLLPPFQLLDYSLNFVTFLKSSK